jgi:hypothetical protein
MTPEEERNLAAAKRWTELYNSKADEFVHECNAPDYEGRTFPRGITVSGIENLGEAYKYVQEVIPDRRHLVRRIMAGGDSVAIEMNYRGTVAKETEGWPPVANCRDVTVTAGPDRSLCGRRYISYACGTG